MGDDENGLFLSVCIGVERRQNQGGVFIIQIAGRFIGEENIRMPDQGANDRRAAELASGKFGGKSIPEMPNAQLFHPLRSDIRSNVFSVKLCREPDVFKYGQRVDDAAALRNDTDFFIPKAGKSPVVQTVEIRAVDPYFALGGLQQSGKHIQQRCFSAAAAPCKHGDLARPDFQAYGFYRIKIICAACFAEIPHGDIFSLDNHISFLPAGPCRGRHGSGDMLQSCSKAPPRRQTEGLCPLPAAGFSPRPASDRASSACFQ